MVKDECRWRMVEMEKLNLINVLGERYTIELATEAEDPLLKDCDGYTDKTTRKIVIASVPGDNELGDFRSYQQKVVRHEIIHAFLFESGLHECWEHGSGHDETYVDWIAVQFPKLLAAFRTVGAI